MCADMMNLKKAKTRIIELEEELKFTRDGYEEEIKTLLEKNDDLVKKIGVFMGGPASRPPGERECGGLSLSHRWSLIRPHSVRRGKGRKCIVSPFDGAEAARPNLRYTPFSLTKLRCGRAYATCSQIPPAAAHLVTSRRPPGIPSGLAPLPVFPRRCMWIFHSSLPKM